MELEQLKPIVGSPHWRLFEEFLEERKQVHIARLVNEEHDKNAAVLRGRLKEIDVLLSITPGIYPKKKVRK